MTATERDTPQPSAERPDLDFGYATRTLRLRGVSGRIGVRLLTVSAMLVALALGLAVVSLTVGDYPLTIGQVLRVLGGGGESFHRIIALEWRLPIAVAAVAFGGFGTLAVVALWAWLFPSLRKVETLSG